MPAMIIYFLIAFIGLGYIDIANLVLGIPLLFLIIIFELYNPAKSDWHRIGSIFSAIVFVVIPFGLMNTLFFSHDTN